MHPRAALLLPQIHGILGRRALPARRLARCDARLAPRLLRLTTARAQQAAAAPPVSFNRDIRPILANNCFACHGPDEKQRETKFHFDTQEGAFLKAGVIERGNAAESLLIEKITDPDPKERMPPPDSGHALTPRQIELLRRWIDEGAKWDTHWAYTAPVRRDPPAVNHAQWARNPIDQFILARLEREGLTPSPEADKTALLRRVTYDLTGLPPTPAEVDAFLADRSPDAYEKRVDALLQSPRYGERMAVPWLDAARYADTHGFHIDSLRGMWPWRDWVIDAFNRNLPFDQFAIEQLAGDLLPNATRAQNVASGFNRNHMINFEGGAIAEEYRVEYVIDRVETTSSAFMGLTMGCARCHSHKYDPITHKEFYQFFAFFNTVPEVGLDGRVGNARPFLQLTSPAQQARLDELNDAITTREEALARRRRRARAARVGADDFRAVRRGERRRADGPLRAGRQLLRHLGPLSARPHDHRRPDLRRRSGRQGRLDRRRHRGQLRQRRQLRSDRRVQPRDVDEGPRHPADLGLPEARGRGAPARLRMEVRRLRARRDSAVGRPADISRWRPIRPRTRFRFARASGCSWATGITSR